MDDTFKQLYKNILQKLEDIEKEINNLPKPNADSEEYNKKRKTIIKQLDDVDREVMITDWGIFNAVSRKNFRRDMKELYKKLKTCPPKRAITHYERKQSEDYKDPEPNNNREDLSTCPESDEPYYNIYRRELDDDNSYSIESILQKLQFIEEDID